MRVSDLLRNHGMVAAKRASREEGAEEEPVLHAEDFKCRTSLPEEVWVFDKAYLEEFEDDNGELQVEFYPAIVKMHKSGDIWDWGEFREMYKPSEEVIPVASKEAARLIAAIRGLQVFDFGTSRLTKRSMMNGEKL